MIAGTGHAAPVRVMRNDEFPAIGIDTSDEWIRARTGIRERHVAGPGESLTSISTQASLHAMAAAGVSAAELDMIIVGTCSPDRLLPSAAVELQATLGASRAVAFDVGAACSGWLYGMQVAEGMMAAGGAETILVVGAELLTRIVNWKDRNTCVLFGDGAGAAILQHRENSHGLLTAVMGADGNKADLLSMPGGGSACPATLESVAAGLHYLRMDGKETFKNAVQAMVSAAHEAMRRCDVDITKIKCVIPHQANQRIVDAVGERLKATPEQLFINLHKYGNTSAASVAIALDEAVHSGKVLRGDLILLVVFGAGLTWGAAVIEW